MSLSVTLSNAVSGLAAMSRSAQVVSTNVANSATEGFARREVELSPRLLSGDGAGVQVDGVTRVIDENLVRERRLASASLGFAAEEAEFYQLAIDAVGEPQDDASLVAKTAALESSLLSAASRPENDVRLQEVLDAAVSIAEKFNSISNSVQNARQDADRKIDQSISFLNDRLAQIDDLNKLILRSRASSQGYSVLLDSRQNLIDEISNLVPLRQIPRENGTVALYTMTGGLLLDAKPVEFSFTRSSTITPDMTITSGVLSGLTVDGREINVSSEYSPIAGGRLAKLFAVRDELATEFQTNLDVIARDLIERFQDPSLDTSLSATSPGLFTDANSQLDPTNVVGVAQRISVNSNANPDQGGEVWRLRDGLEATTQGPPGEPGLLVSLSERLADLRTPTGGEYSASVRGVDMFAADLTSLVGLAQQRSGGNLAFEQGRYISLNDDLLSEGVDTDQELQKLLLIEQAYAANARVIQIADELLQILIGL